MKAEKTTRLPAWVAYAVENGLIDWSDVRTTLPAVTYREQPASPWWRTIAISLVLAFLCRVASQS